MKRKRFKRAKSGVKAGELVDRLPFRRLPGPCGVLPIARWELGRRLRGREGICRQMEVGGFASEACCSYTRSFCAPRLPGGDRRSRRAAFPGPPTLKWHYVKKKKKPRSLGSAECCGFFFFFYPALFPQRIGGSLQKYVKYNRTKIDQREN